MPEQDVYFVYIMLLGKPCPQKWYGSKYHGETGKMVTVAYSVILTDQERNLTIRDLCAKYPFEPHNKEIENVETKFD